MHGGYDSTKDWETNVKIGNARDPLHYCNTIVYWGKTPVEKGSKLEREFAKTQGKEENCTSFVFSLTTRTVPANIFVVPSQNATVLNWAVTIASKEPGTSKNNDRSDLTRRGGGPLTEEEKKKLFDFNNHGKYSKSVVRGMTNLTLLEELIKLTPAKDITEAGLFDRENLDMPFTSESKLVALLGDAAHPQTPFLGQGVNMAITDAYQYATNIAVALNSKTKNLKEAISQCDTDSRRKQAKSVVRQARLFCYFGVSQSILPMSFMRLFTKFAPAEEFMNQITQTDTSNRHYFAELNEKYCSPKEQEALRQKA